MSDAPQPCAHCGLPAPCATGGELAFCCPGCRAVYTALHEGGLSSFYALRDASSQRAQEPPSVVEGEGFEALDAPAFTATHATPLTDGSLRAELAVDGVHCVGCVWLIERLPSSIAGVCEARLDLPRARVTLTWRPEVVRLSTVARWLGRLGYRLHGLRTDKIAARSQVERRLLIKVGACWALAANVMILAVALYAGLDVESDATMTRWVWWLSAGLATLSVVWGGAEFFRRAVASVQAILSGAPLRALSMDVPIALGILVGYSQSVYATVVGQGELWFDSIAVLIAALLTARWLQLRGRRAARDASERLLSLIPQMALRLGPDGVEMVVNASDLEPGDRVRVRSGDAVPADGVVETGRSTLDRAVLTGESRPEAIGPGDVLHAGAINLGALIEVRVSAAGERSRVGQLMTWLEARGADRAPVVQLTDRIAGVFVVTVVAAAALTATAWSFINPEVALDHAVALLVIACPCALGMATPLALAVSTGRAARRGIFVKHDDVLERLAGLTTIVLDKTGTLTRGEATVVEVEGDARAVAMAAALETRSSHPLAHALTTYAPPTGLERVTDVVERAGAGMSGVVDGHRVEVGAPDHVAAKLETTRAAQELIQDAQAIAERGQTPVAIAVDGLLAALVAIGDDPRPEARAILAGLRTEGIDVYVLSGDHPAAVAHVAHALGVDEDHTRGGVDPEHKQAFIEALVASGETVAMVGDGVNDAGALQAADVGIAVAGSAEASVVGADIFLTRQGLEPLRELIDGARSTMAGVRRNLAVSLLYNAAGLTFAALGLVSPLVAAVAMPLSSLFVVASSILQRPYRARRQRDSPPAAKRLEPTHVPPTTAQPLTAR